MSSTGDSALARIGETGPVAGVRQSPDEDEGPSRRRERFPAEARERAVFAGREGAQFPRGEAAQTELF